MLRLEAGLVCTVRYALSLPLSLPARTSECLWEHSRCLSSTCIVVGAVTVTPAKNFVSPLSESSSSPRKHKKNKNEVSVAARQSVHPSERSPTLPSSSGLCVGQIENEQQSTVGKVSHPVKVMAPASRLAGPDNAVTSLPGSDSWLSKKKQKNIRSTSWCSQATFQMLSEHLGSGRQQTCLDQLPRSLVLGSSRAFDFV